MTVGLLDFNPEFQDAKRSLEAMASVATFSAKLLGAGEVLKVDFYLKAANPYVGALAPGISYALKPGIAPPDTAGAVNINLSDPFTENIGNREELLFAIIPAEPSEKTEYESPTWLDTGPETPLYYEEPWGTPIEPVFNKEDIEHYQAMLGEAQAQNIIADRPYPENLAFRNEQAILDKVGMFGGLEGSRQGALAAAAGLGVMFPWVTVGDTEVCDDCADLEDGGPYPVDEYPEPPHFGCRCNDPFPDPIPPEGEEPPGEEGGYQELLDLPLPEGLSKQDILTYVMQQARDDQVSFNAFQQRIIDRATTQEINQAKKGLRNLEGAVKRFEEAGRLPSSKDMRMLELREKAAKYVDKLEKAFKEDKWNLLQILDKVADNKVLTMEERAIWGRATAAEKASVIDKLDRMRGISGVNDVQRMRIIDGPLKYPSNLFEDLGGYGTWLQEHYKIDDDVLEVAQALWKVRNGEALNEAESGILNNAFQTQRLKDAEKLVNEVRAMDKKLVDGIGLDDRSKVVYEQIRGTKPGEPVHWSSRIKVPSGVNADEREILAQVMLKNQNNEPLNFLEERMLQNVSQRQLDAAQGILDKIAAAESKIKSVGGNLTRSEEKLFQGAREAKRALFIYERNLSKAGVSLPEKFVIKIPPNLNTTELDVITAILEKAEYSSTIEDMIIDKAPTALVNEAKAQLKIWELMDAKPGVQWTQFEERHNMHRGEAQKLLDMYNTRFKTIPKEDIARVARAYDNKARGVATEREVAIVRNATREEAVKALDLIQQWDAIEMRMQVGGPVSNTERTIMKLKTIPDYSRELPRTGEYVGSLPRGQKLPIVDKYVGHAGDGINDPIIFKDTNGIKWFMKAVREDEAQYEMAGKLLSQKMGVGTPERMIVTTWDHAKSLNPSLFDHLHVDTYISGTKTHVLLTQAIPNSEIFSNGARMSEAMYQKDMAKLFVKDVLIYNTDGHNHNYMVDGARLFNIDDSISGKVGIGEHRPFRSDFGEYFVNKADISGRNINAFVDQYEQILNTIERVDIESLGLKPDIEEELLERQMDIRFYLEERVKIYAGMIDSPYPYDH